MKLFNIADQYIQESDWKILALVKFCLCAMGVLIGLAVGVKASETQKKAVAIGSAVIFVITYIILMTKFFRIAFRKAEIDQ